MSALRTRLMTVAALAAALATAASGWAQYGAYGARAVVEHNDLRWFEPVDLDLDGQMPHRDVGYFFSAEKLWETVVNDKYEIGHPGLTVNSEEIFRNPEPEVAILAIEQILAFQFIQDIGNDTDELQAAIAFTGLQILNEDGTPFNVTSLAALKTALRLDPGNAGRAVVGGAPQPYQVRNGIRDAFPDAGFAWGERYEFGYSDGERGWMITVLDGPESVAGGTFGAGEDAPYTSQSGTDVPGPDPNFAADLEDDDGDGRLDGDGELGSVDLFALGFGSVAVNFNLPAGSPDFLRGYRDYNNGDSPFTTTGPIVYVGNTGTEFTDINVVGFDLGAGTGVLLDTDTAVGAANDIVVEIDGVTEMDQADLAASASTINSEVVGIRSALVAAGVIEPDLSGGTVVEGLLIDLLGANNTNTGDINALQTLINNATIVGGGDDMLTDATQKQTIRNNTTDLAVVLLQLDAELGGLSVGGGTGTGQTLAANNEDRLADDANGNGAQGFRLVRGDIDGDGIIEADEVVALILDFGDLHEFNVFFDEVTTRNKTEIDGFEFMRMHELSTRHKLEQGRWDNLRFSWGVRFLDIDDDFYFQGLGSILGRTTVETEVENQIIGPQLGLKWTRRDGPWNFVVEGRGMLGYNRTDVDQNGIFGEELVPGALNRPAVARTTTSVDGTHFDEFSPVAELRAQLKYRLAESVSLSAGYTAKYIGNVHRSYSATAFNAPDWGVLDAKDHIFSNGLSLGVELRH